MQTPVYARDVRIGDVVADSYYAPPTMITVTAIRGGSTFTFWGDDGEIRDLLPTNTLILIMPKGRP